MKNLIKATATATATAIRFIYNDRKERFSDPLHYFLEREHKLNKELNRISHAQSNFNINADACLAQIREHKARTGSIKQRMLYRVILAFSLNDRIKQKY